jgi:HK97 family phage prohead protease
MDRNSLFRVQMQAQQRKGLRMELKHLDIDFEIKAAEGGLFEGYASTAGNVDRGGDVVMEGAFSKSLDRWKAKGKLPKMLWQHDPDKPIGAWTDMSEDAKGLYVKGRLLTDLALGKEAYTLVKEGVIDSMSIGYQTKDYDYEGAGSQKVRQLKEVELWEVSLVTFPMNPQAEVTGVKQLTTRTDLERILRKEGVPGNFAKLIALYGFEEAVKRTDGQRKADGVAIEQDAARRLMETLKAREGLINAQG